MAASRTIPPETPAERCRSGRTGRSRKPLWVQAHPGFESLSLRHKSSPSGKTGSNQTDSVYMESGPAGFLFVGFTQPECVQSSQVRNHSPRTKLTGRR